MAHKKGQGHSSNGRDSAPKSLGVKKFGGEYVKAGTAEKIRVTLIASPAGLTTVAA